MRSTFGRTNWLQDKNGKLVGVTLGADATTDHEIGTKGIARAFGYDYGAGAGVAARQITKLPSIYGVADVTYDKQACLLLSSNLENAKRYLGKELWYPSVTLGGTPDTSAAWDDQNFAILTRGSDIPHLQQFAAAFARKDIMAGGLLGKLYPLTGLTFAIASEVPEQLLKDTQQELDEELERKAILVRSGIHALLNEASLKWFSLDRTSWADTDKKSIRVWLNPSEQRRYRCGWFTLAELRQWAKGEGPIIVKAGETA